MRRTIGRLAIAGFAGTSIPVELRALAGELGLGGVILFARNVEAPEQVAELAHAACALSPMSPPWVSVDQEGGRVARLRAPFTRWPAMRALGISGDATLATRFGRALALELRAVGVTLDYAPVLDVDTNPGNPVIGDRALSAEPERAARLGVAVIDGLQTGGVAACGKHYPGHGDAAADSHVELPVVAHARERLRSVELEPFRAAAAAGVAAIMTAHVLYPSLDDRHPATLSPRIVGMLRDELDFDGLVMSDDLEMGAITRHCAVEDAAVGAIAAGCDMVLLCGSDTNRQAAAIEALIHAVEDGRLPLARVDAALARQERVKARFLAGVRDWRPPRPAELRAAVGTAGHVAVAREMENYLS